MHDIPQRGLLGVIAPGHLDNGISEPVEHSFRIVPTTIRRLLLDKLLQLFEIAKVFAPGHERTLLRLVITITNESKS